MEKVLGEEINLEVEVYMAKVDNVVICNTPYFMAEGDELALDETKT